MKNINELEQSIMDCWTVVDNLNSIKAAVENLQLSPRQVASVLDGLSVLYDIKFNSLFNAFEEIIHNG